MKTRILLVTPDAGFGELIDQVLVEDGDYEVDFVPGGIDALDVSQEHRYALAILDCAVADVPFTELAGTLLNWQTGLKLIVVPPENDPDHPAVQPIRPHAFLMKPFYLPDLLQLVSGILDGGQPMRAAAPTPAADRLESFEPLADAEPYPWLADVTTAAQYLARLTLETAAKAALITRGERLWAYAGELGQPGGDRLAETVGRQWGSQSGNDLARFVTLDNDQEYMLYATGLVDGMVLSLIFDARTPFSKIRSQSSRLARALSADPDDPAAAQAAPAASMAPATSAAPATSPAPATSTAPASEPPPSGEPAGRPGRDVEPTEPPARRRDPAGDRAASGSAPAAHPDFALSNAFDESVYARPAPVKRDLPPEPEPELEAVETENLLLDWLPPDLYGDPALLEEMEGTLEPFAIPPDWQPRQDLAAGPRGILEEILGEPVAPPAPPSVEDSRPFYPPPETMAETRPTRALIDEQAARLEPDTASYSNITFACVLIPRLPKHHLVGELAKRLEEWMFELCLSFDWRIEQLSIRPDYMQWMVRVHSATAPRYLMQITNRITSQRIFEHFVNLRSENPSGEFWAPGWLVSTGDKLPPALVREFIRKTRKRQGV